MLGLMAMFLQAAPGSADPPPLATGHTAPCPPDADGDIVVCGRQGRDEAYRLRPLPERYVEDQRLRLKLPGDATVSPHADQGRLGDLQAKVTLKIPF
ncbi:hypothetical protein AWL63_03885 [Sphingomonas panacis]|uniref:Uncharacterized protein n=1 Tax=Sphingomonas panacis TaxID=1560345 RepID=A0A1B3Z733_9SPHN|nr:hypothetical protein [Sphingomonas panacis]AOH83239.1 hypothetical protein AWL63_03885 [Sphingomonas panacis]